MQRWITWVGVGQVSELSGSSFILSLVCEFCRLLQRRRTRCPPQGSPTIDSQSFDEFAVRTDRTKLFLIRNRNRKSNSSFGREPGKTSIRDAAGNPCCHFGAVDRSRRRCRDAPLKCNHKKHEQKTQGWSGTLHDDSFWRQWGGLHGLSAT